MNESKLASGMFIDMPHQNAPHFVMCKISVKCQDFYHFMKQNANEKGYVNIDVLISKSGKPYAKLNDWKPSKGENTAASFGNTPQAAASVTENDNIPF